MLTHCGTQQIETEKMILRPFEMTDWVSMKENWVSDPKVQHGYMEPVYETEAEIKALLQQYMDSYQKSGTYRWAIILKETGECIGQIAYFLVDSKNHFGEIEYCVGRQFQNQGLVTEATKAVIEYGFRRINFNKVQICHRANNLPSKRVIEKIGFIYEGTLRAYFYMDGEYIDRLYYSILKSEWNPA